MNKRKKLILKLSVGGVSIFSVLVILILLFVIKPSNAYANNQFTQIDPKTLKLANRYVKIWESPELRKQCLSQLHQQNPEWDFMFRTYSVLSFANMAFHDSSNQQRYLQAMDLIINDTLKLEQQYGFKYFLLGYGQGNQWVVHPGRSLFIDGEIALMLGFRCLVENNNETFLKELAFRTEIIVDGMKQSQMLCAESYPDECWIFCNTIALAAIKISDKLNKTDHSEFFELWVKSAKKNLVDQKTGLLRSAFALDGHPVISAKGPEGSSIWMSCHMLQVVDETFAQEQYDKAKKELIGDIFGFGYSREWPIAHKGGADIDSGPVIPYLNASPSASGLAIVCTASFKDKECFNKLTKSLNSFAFPAEDTEDLYYQVSNPLGDSVLLYGFTVGPVWEKVNSAEDTE